MAYAIEAALKSEVFSRVIVSTDSERYAEIAKDYGITEKTASMRLARLREKLQQYLQEKELI